MSIIRVNLGIYSKLQKRTIKQEGYKKYKRIKYTNMKRMTQLPCCFDTQCLFDLNYVIRSAASSLNT